MKIVFVGALPDEMVPPSMMRICDCDQITSSFRRSKFQLDIAYLCTVNAKICLHCRLQSQQVACLPKRNGIIDRRLSTRVYFNAETRQSLAANAELTIRGIGNTLQYVDSERGNSDEAYTIDPAAGSACSAESCCRISCMSDMSTIARASVADRRAIVPASAVKTLPQQAHVGR